MIMVDVDNDEDPNFVLGWLNSHGVTTVTCLVYGSSTYGPFGDGYIPYNVFLDTDFIVRFTDSGYSQASYNTWASLVDQYAIDYDYPLIQDMTWEMTDDGNDDNHPDAGENCAVTFTVSNFDGCAEAVNVTGELFNDDPAIDITNPYCTFPDIPGGDTVNSTTVEFYVDAGLEPHQSTFWLTVFADNLPAPRVFEFTLGLGRASWLVVDDDGGDDDVEWIVSSFENMDMYVDVWDGSVPVNGETMSNYEIVFWATGINQSTLDLDEQAAVIEYLDGGGNLLLSSQYLGEELGGTAFFSDVLHAEHTTDNMQYSWVDGIAGTPIADGMGFLLAGSGNGAANSVSPSAMNPIAPAVAFLEYADQSEYAGTLYDNGSSRVIYMGFPV
ncbi:hypothetical protein H8D51_00750, partial [bacterium]|nr:hypothetical protein [bacterium]